MRSIRRALPLPLLLVLVISGARAQEPERVKITFPAEGLELSEAVKRASTDTGRSFLLTNSVKQRSTGKKLYMQGEANVLRSELFDWWQSVFVTQNFAVVPLGPEGAEFLLLEDTTTSKLLKQRARFTPISELAALKRRAGLVVMTPIVLDHVEAADVRTAVGRLLQNQQVEFVQEVQNSGTLLVVGFAPTVWAIHQLARAMDIPVAAQTLRFERIPLKYAIAEEMQPIIADLLSTSSGAPTGAPVRPGATAGAGERPEPKLLADPRTNSLIVYAVEEALDEIKRLVSFLDVEAKRTESDIRIYYLSNRDAADVADTLREVVGQSGTRSTRPTGVRGGAGSQLQTTNAVGQEVIIVPDANTNSLLISSSRTRYEELEKLIRELDRRRPQVLVQAAIAELSDTDVRNIAVELTAVQGGNPDYRFAGGTAFGLSSILSGGVVGGGDGTGGTGTGTGGGTGGGTTTDPVTGILDGLVRVPFAAADGISFSGLAAGVLHGDLDLPLLVNLLKTTTNANLVSVPSVLTNDNEQSTIVVGNEVPTVSFNTTQAGTDSTAFQGYEEANLQLTVSPSISNDRYLRLDIELIVDAFAGSGTAGIPPPKTSRTFTGSVTIRDGQTVVIGGLVQRNETISRDGIPFLMDIPILGTLFRSEGKSYENTTLYLFLTPKIFDGFERLETESARRKLELQQLGGRIRLVDPNFRPVDWSDARLDLEKLQRSGILDLPEYAPSSPRRGETPAASDTSPPR